MKRIFVTLLTCALAAGCTTVRMPETASNHPAHPDAPPGEPWDLPNVLEIPAQPVIQPPLPISAGRDTPGEHSMSATHAGHGQMPAMGPSYESSEGSAAAAMGALYACPIHPEITSRNPGQCPRCGIPLNTGRTVQGHVHDSSQTAVAGDFVCPMHPEVTATGPSTCPECGMALIRREELER